MNTLSGKPSFRVYTKAETNCSLTIRDGQVVLALVDHSDPFQHWVKDERSASDFEDEEGFPSFALINKATGQVMKHSVGAANPVLLIPYVPDELDESVLWTFSQDKGDGYRAMRMVNNIRLNVDAFHDGSIHDGTIVGLWECGEGENQLWKMVPQQDELKPQAWDYLSRMPSVRVYTKAETSCSLAIREGEVILARANLSDPTQHWLKVEKYSTEVKDEYGFPSFALVNKATGQAMKPAGASHPVELITYVPDAHDETVLWTLAEDLGDGYRAMRMVNNTLLNVDALHDGSIHDGTSIGLWEWLHGENQLWKVVPHPDVPTHQVLDRLNQMPSIRVYTKAETHCSLAIRDGNVIVAWADTSDPSQYWVKDEKYSTLVTDEYGFPSFALVNKATGQAMKHSDGDGHLVELIPYVPDVLDVSILWALAEDLGDGYRAMRMVNDIRLNVYALHDGSIHDGTFIGIGEWADGDNQQWMMVPAQDVPKPLAWDRLSWMPSVRVYTKAETNCSLAIRDSKVILARANISDATQHWLKVEKYSTEVKDEYGFHSFALVNKATGQAMKPAGASHPVELIPYVPDAHDETVLWTLAEDLGDDYRAMRMVNNTCLNVDAFHDGSIHDGTIIGLWEWMHGENQLWKVVPHPDVPTHQVLDFLNQMPSVRVYTKAETHCSLAIRDGKVIIARADTSDPTQHWVKNERYSNWHTDEYGFPSFALVNKATGQAMKHSVGAGHLVELIPYVPDVLDESILWALAEDLGDGYRAMRMVDDTDLNVDAFHDGSIHDGTFIGIWEWTEGDNQQWKIVLY